MTRLVTPDLGHPAPGTTLVCNNKRELLECMNYADMKGLPCNREQIVNFGGTPFNVNDGNSCVYHWNPCNYFNHSAAPNVVIALSPLQDGKAYIVALRDIAEGEEFFQDYRLFSLPEWFTNLCSEWNRASTEALGYEISSDEGFRKGSEDIQSVHWPDLKSTDEFQPAYISDVPWSMNPFYKAGWTVKTQIKKSTIPQAGRARFLLEPVKRGAIIRMTRLVTPDLGHPAPGTTLVCNNKRELLECMNYADEKGLPCNREQIVNFGGTPFNVKDGNLCVYHWNPCNYFNHSAAPNVVIALPPTHDGNVYIVALRDIDAGEEFFQDYRFFSMPTWFGEFCSEWQLTMTEDLGYLVSGKEDFAKGSEDMSFVQWPHQG